MLVTPGSKRVKGLLEYGSGNKGLCSKGARVPQETNFCLWATR